MALLSAVCFTHSLEYCDICMMDMTLPNQLGRERKELGRDLTKDEYATQEATYMVNMNINQKICIMDGKPICPGSGRKLMCPCHQVTYCSTACQKHHWQIHKMTCKVRAKAKVVLVVLLIKCVTMTCLFKVIKWCCWVTSWWVWSVPPAFTLLVNYDYKHQECDE